MKSIKSNLWQKAIAKERIQILFNEAKVAARRGKLDLADRYVEIARKIGMRYNVRIPTILKRNFCKYCYAYLSPNSSCSVKIDPKEKLIKVRCFRCNKVIHYKYK